MSSVDYLTQKKYWEQASERRSPLHPAVLAFARPKLELVAATIGTGLTILEVGAGNGYLTHTFSECYRMTALDFSARMLTMNWVKTVPRVQGDAERLPFAAHSFDVVFCANLLHHLESPRLAVAEMRRVARRHVVLLEPNILNPLMLAFGVLKREERGSLKFTPGYLRRLGLSQGLTLKVLTSMGAIVPNKTPESAVPLLSAIDACYPIPVGFYNIAIFDRSPDR